MNETSIMALFAGWMRGPLRNTAGEGGGSGGGSVEGGDTGEGGDNGGEGGNAGAGGNGEPPDGEGTDGEGGATGGEGGDFEYDLQYADGFKLSEEKMEQWQNTLREAGITPEQANALVEQENAWMQETMEQHQAQLDSYAEAVESDRFLSEDWDLTVKRMEAGLEAANVSDDFKEWLKSDDATLVAANPNVIRAFAMLGKLTSNDNFERGDPSTNTAPSHESWYGNTTPKSKKG